MDLGGRHMIPAPPGRVWQALNDEHVLRVCIPGCESLDREGDDAFRARIVAKIGAMKSSFVGRVTLTDRDPPNAYTINGQGDGGASGFARGSARVQLAEQGDATLLSWEAKAEVGGKLAAVGSRLIKGVAAKTADEFFTRFSAVVAQGGDMARANSEADDHRVSSATPPERYGPADRLVGDIHRVPPTPTIPYTLGQTPRQQTRVMAVAFVCWAFVTAIIFLIG